MTFQCSAMRSAARYAIAPAGPGRIMNQKITPNTLRCETTSASSMASRATSPGERLGYAPPRHCDRIARARSTSPSRSAFCMPVKKCELCRKPMVA